MNDFSQRFQKYSNTDLLKIINQPDDYQSEAFETAKQILATRIVTEDDHKNVELYFNEIALEKSIRKEKIESFNRNLLDFLQPILKPENTVSPSKWLPIFLVLVAIQYLYMLVMASKDMIKYINRGIPFDGFLAISLIGILYIPFIFTLLYRRKRWGWILLMADNILSAIITLGQSYNIFKYQEYFPDGPIEFIWQMIIHIVFILFLWRNDISGFFNIDPEAKLRISVILTIIGGLIVLLMIGLGFT